MSQQNEIEFKTLLTKDDYNRIIQYYQLQGTDFHTQKNCYFDTSDQKLAMNHCGLRIRQFATYGELTLKTPAKVGLLETTDQLNVEQTEQLINQQKILTNGHVADKLAEYSITAKDLILFAELTTKRAEFPIDEGLLALDESWYADQHDYELELEVENSEKGKEDFKKLLAKFDITYSPAKNKIERAAYAQQ
ncbi:adenylate cyclase [Tetragenococcus halophilus subsp. flandriensis]|uniref:CYTH domain-containing protein n=1 Tax=Tetragenococcus halophilus TaxID=51669 RepID=UPI0023E90764|nr:CYTH domain-containing protein [Tetragenococcus halophilus]GMA07131.1 adenylate cyclase [Tetragenococcus halophilus subsp. flandriensis]